MIAADDVTPTCQPPRAASQQPSYALPAGTIDAHCHLFGPHDRFPYAAGRVFTPPDAPLEQLRAVHGSLGVDRAVLVQSAAHGTDHAAMLAALDAHPEAYVGVAILADDATDDDVKAFDERRVVGARFHLAAHMGHPPDVELVRRQVAMIAPYGWHAELHVMGADLVAHRDVIAALEAPVVIDHMSRPDIALGVGSEQVETLLGLMDLGHVWVKLSGYERISGEASPYSDAVELGRTIARHRPDRIVWGSDYPHPNIAGEMVDDGVLVDIAASVVTDPQQRQAFFVDTAASLFGFAA